MSGQGSLDCHVFSLSLEAPGVIDLGVPTGADANWVSAVATHTDTVFNVRF